jgi:iron complex transport system substrate-binding protein
LNRMRVVSLLPGATEVVAALGLVDAIVGVSHECDYPTEISRKPVLVRPRIDSDRVSSSHIDRQVRTAASNAETLYLLDDVEFRAAQPDLVITQQLCDVCAITPTALETALRALTHPVEVLSLQPSRLEDVLLDIERIGRAVCREAMSRELVGTLRWRLQKLQESLAGKVRRPRVACLEWLDPLYLAGHWVPDMIAAAGGLDVLGKAGGMSQPISLMHVVAAAPEVIILAPCGFTARRTVREFETLALPELWAQFPVLRASRVFAVDAAAYFSRPGPRLIDGVERLAALIHPDLSSMLFPNSRQWPPGIEPVPPLTPSSSL